MRSSPRSATSTTSCGPSTYFGDSRYDGRYWHNFLAKDSGLPSNFTNFVKGVDASRAWFCTDKGLAYYDGVNWAVYRPSLKDGKPEMMVRDAQGRLSQSPSPPAPAHNYILGIDFQGSDIWVATAKGLSHGILQPQSNSTESKEIKAMSAFAEILETVATRAGREARLTNHEVLNEAFAYAKPSSFSRGMRIDLNGLTILLISGTASIDERGKSVHVGDFRAQIAAHLRQHHRAAEQRRLHLARYRAHHLLPARYRTRLRGL